MQLVNAMKLMVVLSECLLDRARREAGDDGGGLSASGPTKKCASFDRSAHLTCTISVDFVLLLFISSEFSCFTIFGACSSEFDWNYD